VRILIFAGLKQDGENSRPADVTTKVRSTAITAARMQIPNETGRSYLAPNALGL